MVVKYKVDHVYDVVGKTRQQVDDEPALNVVSPDDPGIRDDLSSGTDVRGVEVDGHVSDEDEVLRRKQRKLGF